MGHIEQWTWLEVPPGKSSSSCVRIYYLTTFSFVSENGIVPKSLTLKWSCFLKCLVLLMVQCGYSNWYNKNKDITGQNPCNKTKAVFRGKLIATNSYTKKGENKFLFILLKYSLFTMLCLISPIQQSDFLKSLVKNQKLWLC